VTIHPCRFRRTRFSLSTSKLNFSTAAFFAGRTIARNIPGDPNKESSMVRRANLPVISRPH
jgi:hypothetical protein